MTADLTDEELADDLEAQLRLITDAYRRGGDDYEVDQVLSHVSWVRRMKRRGIYEVFSDVPEAEEDHEDLE
ncbi:hypothetical protein [Leisingera sp. M658]|uniref:hypothetical protein n=1 Tax=Leisingera sp. M658 TaxID=2867015 RepID=UPI0021A7EAEE|nr:hypothetical protein [Leisingera sp. M658]UWQ74336.1 hypothetical protein K3724_17870 [Leisingera sp. M658]